MSFFSKKEHFLKQNRRNLIEKIRNTIKKKAGEPLDYKKLIAFISLETGTSNRTCKEYIDNLITIGEVIKEKDFIFYNPIKLEQETHPNEML